MRFYWPCAIREFRGDGKQEPLFTYEPALTFEKAVSQIEFWRDVGCMKLVKAWVEVREGKGSRGLVESISVEV